MPLTQESEKKYPVLLGRSVVIIESPKTADELFAHLTVSQGMKVDFINQVDFPDDLAQYMEDNELESCIVHVPGVATSEGANAYAANIYRAYGRYPRMIILEGIPVNRETIDMYEAFREADIPMVDKSLYANVVEKLAELFTLP